MQILESNGVLYTEKRKIRKDRFTDLEQVKQYRDFIYADHVLNFNDFYIFCNKIDDVEFEEIGNLSNG